MHIKAQQVESWVKENAHDYNLNDEEITVIARGLWSMYEYKKHGIKPSAFIMAVLNNDLERATTIADNINRKALALYSLFIMNMLPFELYKDIR